jgi:hypothetical protein
MSWKFAEIGWTRCESDHAVFVMEVKSGSSPRILASHVDDILLAVPSEIAHRLKKRLMKQFDMRDLGPANWFMAMAITRNRPRRTITISQRQFITTILARFGLSDVKGVSVPLPANMKVPKRESPTVSVHLYQSLLGSLMYAMTGTRPDIAFAVGFLSQHSATPGDLHLSLLKRVFRYLAKTIDLALTFDGSDLGSLTGYVDSDWAGDSAGRRSVTGYVFTLAGAAISWASKKQPTVALSSTEGEYMASTNATCEAVWLRRLLSELGLPQTKPTPLHVDNQSAIALARTANFSSRTKHIEVRHHFVRKKIESEEIDLVYLPTNDQTADVLTKALPYAKHHRFATDMGLVSTDTH